MAAESGGWFGLLAITREQRETSRAFVSMRPTHCPHDGTLLVRHPRTGALHCTFDGYEPTSQDHP